MIDLSIFNNLSPNFDKLATYGFKQNNGEYIYSKDICEDFIAKFTISQFGVSLDVFELDTNDKLQLFYLSDISGSFIGEINSACEKLALDIINKCYTKPQLHGAVAENVTDYITQKYGDKFEALWEKFPEDGIWRRSDNKKWYALLMKVERCKVYGNSKEKVDVLGLRYSKAEIQNAIDNVRIYPGYHMNKKSWITVFLDGATPLEFIFNLIDNSYILAKEK